MLSRYLALDDFDPAAKRILPRCIYGYIAGGSETCTTLNGNRTAFDSYRFVPRVLTDTSVRSQQTENVSEKVVRGSGGMIPLRSALAGSIVPSGSSVSRPEAMAFLTLVWLTPRWAA